MTCSSVSLPSTTSLLAIASGKLVNRRWVRDAMVGGNIGRFVNHGCKPNCYSEIVGKQIWIRAGRNIKPGEELTYNYFTDGERVIKCHCRPGCKKWL